MTMLGNNPNSHGASTEKRRPSRTRRNSKPRRWARFQLRKNNNNIRSNTPPPTTAADDCVTIVTPMEACQQQSLHSSLSQEQSTREMLADGSQQRREGMIVVDFDSELEALTQFTYVTDESKSATVSTSLKSNEESNQERITFLNDFAFAVNFEKLAVETLNGLKGKQMILMAHRQPLCEALHQDYTDVFLMEMESRDDQFGSGKSNSTTVTVEASLHAADHLLQEFLAVQAVVQQTSMPASLQEILFDILESYLQPRIADLYSVLTDVTPQDAVKIMSWTDEFLQTLEKMCPLLEPKASWRADAERLFEHYLEQGVRKEMRELLHRILEAQQHPKSTHAEDDPLRQNADGHMVSGFPDQIGYLIELQLSVAKGLLPGEHAEQVLNVINQEMYYCMVSDLMLQVEATWKSMSSRRLCAIINDATRLSDLVEERNQTLLTTPEYVQQGDNLSRELAEVSMHATRYLCEHIVHSLKEPTAILSSVGDADWESDGPGSQVVERTIATLQDFFSDIEQWLIDANYFFPKVLKHCFDLILETYVASFFSNTLTRGVTNVESVSLELYRDYVRLMRFFESEMMTQYHGVAGFYGRSEIRANMAIVKSCAHILDLSKEPEDLEYEMKVIMVRLGYGRFDELNAAEPAMLHLAGLRGKHTYQEAIPWLRTISLVRKEIQEDHRGEADFDEDVEDEQSVVSAMSAMSTTNENDNIIRVPDLRNSKFIRNVHVRERDLELHCSLNSRLAMESTQKLVARPKRRPLKERLVL